MIDLNSSYQTSLSLSLNKKNNIYILLNWDRSYCKDAIRCVYKEGLICYQDIVA